MELHPVQEGHLQIIPPRGSDVTLSLVIPIYNFGRGLRANVAQVIEHLRQTDVSFELILFNDGSTDNTLSELKSIAALYPEARFIDGGINRGKGYGVKQGMMQAGGDFIFFTDVDLPYGVEPIVTGVRILLRRQVDIILGSRDLPESKDIVAYSFKRKVTTKVFSLIVNAVLGLGITDPQCGFKGFRRDVARDIFTSIQRNDFSFDIEVLYLARRRHYSMELIPVNLRHSKFSTVSIVRDSVKMLWGVFATLINGLRGRYKYRRGAIGGGREIRC